MELDVSGGRCGWLRFVIEVRIAWFKKIRETKTKKVQLDGLGWQSTWIEILWSVKTKWNQVRSHIADWGLNRVNE